MFDGCTKCDGSLSIIVLKYVGVTQLIFHILQLLQINLHIKTCVAFAKLR